MPSLLFRRIAAFAADQVLILLYAALLLGVTLLFYGDAVAAIEVPDPVSGQLVGLITLTIPVFLYFYYSERTWGQTLGKRWQGLQVVPHRGKNAILVRNLLKLAPWEFAHTGVHWLMFYHASGTPPSWWVWALLIVPQIVVLIYIASLFMSRGKFTLYDCAAGTEVMRTEVSCR